MGQGTNLGHAQGSITINTTQAQQAPAVMQGVANGINRAMGSVNTSINRAQTSINGLTGALSGVGGALGVSLGVAGVVQLGRFALGVDAISTAYRRQTVAALDLAGSQGQLNELLDAYDKATGGAIDKATALADVTKLQAVGFADSAEELDRFATAARGISIAMGSTQDYVISQMQLAIANQSTLRLDQLGLGVSEVKQRIDELKAANKGLTDEMAYQQAILDLATEKFGALAKSADAGATGAELAAAAWKNLRLQLGGTGGGAIDAFMGKLADNLDNATAAFARLQDAIEGYKRSAAAMVSGGAASQPFYNSFSVGSGGSIGGGPGSPDAATAPDTRQAKLDWAQGVSDLNKQTNDQILSQTETYNRQRASAESNYQKGVLREQEDFARSRQRAEAALADSISDIHAGAARREEQMARDLARSIGQARADSADRLNDLQADLDRNNAERRQASAKKVAEWEEDRAESIAEARAKSTERIAEMEAQHQKAREQAAKQHLLTMLGALSRLDAVAIWREQKKWELENATAKEAHAEKIADEEEKLDEAIDQLNAAHAERIADEAEALQESITQANQAHARQVADEKKALEKRITQAQEAHALQLEDARAADALRIEDMRKDFEERIRQENEDRATRLTRDKADHAAQLTEMDTQQGLRIAQIIRQAQETRTQLDDEHKAELIRLGAANEAWIAVQDAKERDLEALWDKFFGHVSDTLTAPLPAGMTFGEDAMPPGFSGGAGSVGSSTTNVGAVGNNSKVVTVAPGAITINATPQQSTRSIAEEVLAQLKDILGSLGWGG